MCTLTFARSVGGVLITMNRDDAPAREETAPRQWDRAGHRFVAPLDALGGGTWMAANRYGVTACLLNRYDPAPAGDVTRGAIVPEAMGGDTVDSAVALVTRLDHKRFSPFSCIVVSTARAARLDWTGDTLVETTLPVGSSWMATSSSWRPDFVTEQRQALFDACLATECSVSSGLEAFHCMRKPEDDVWAPMMLREHSQTKSVTQVELGDHASRMSYWRRESAILNRFTAPDVVLDIV